MENWVLGGRVVLENDWQKFVDGLKGKPLVDDKQKCISLVRGSFVEAVKKRIPAERFGIFLSGGVDSSLIALAAQKLGGKFACYTVGYGESEDVRFSRVMFETFGFEWKLQLYSLDEVEGLLKRSAAILAPVGLVDPVHVSIGAVVIAAVSVAKNSSSSGTQTQRVCCAQKDDVDTFLGGLGAEEIFAGYKRHLGVDDVNKECWRGLKAMWNTDLVRDAALGKALGVTVLTPFLDDKLISVAMQVPGSLKVIDGERKVILREVAEEYGVPHEVAWRRKKAAQYGSGFDKALEKLAKRNKMTKEGYVRSLSKDFKRNDVD
jgi:asparagine synthase (glutamine-hydrolysing)